MAGPSSTQLEALMRVYETAQRDHGGSGVCARFLLSLYNGFRFKFDLTDLRRLDQGLFEACLQVLCLDRLHHLEVHAQIAVLQGKPTQVLNLEFERWAHTWKVPGRCKKAELDGLAERVKRTMAARAAEGAMA